MKKKWNSIGLAKTISEIINLFLFCLVRAQLKLYIAREERFGCTQTALQPLAAEFPNLFSMEMLAQEGELSLYINLLLWLLLTWLHCLTEQCFLMEERKMGQIMRVSAQEI